MKKFIEEFKEFAIGGTLIDMAVGVIIGGAFNAIVGSLVADVFTPLLGMIFTLFKNIVIKGLKWEIEQTE